LAGALSVRRELWRGRTAEEGMILSADDDEGRGIWIMRTHIDGTQTVLIPWAALPAIELEAARAIMADKSWAETISSALEAARD
jgi:hypothetical protein